MNYSINAPHSQLQPLAIPYVSNEITNATVAKTAAHTLLGMFPSAIYYDTFSVCSEQMLSECLSKRPRAAGDEN
jgi:hypothetical protein